MRKYFRAYRSFLIGQGLNMDYIAQLEKKIEKLIGRKISFDLLQSYFRSRTYNII